MLTFHFGNKFQTARPDPAALASAQAPVKIARESLTFMIGKPLKCSFYDVLVRISFFNMLE